MEKIIMYKCGICGALYSEERFAKKCENLHILPIKILGSSFVELNALPKLVELEMDDGSITTWNFVNRRSGNINEQI